MKNTISSKLFYIMTAIIIFIIVVYFLLNTLMLEKYYINSKQQQLIQIYDVINKLLNEKNDLESEDVKLELERLSENKNINITVQALDGTNLYNSGAPIELNRTKRINIQVLPGLDIFNGNNDYAIDTQNSNIGNNTYSSSEEQFANYSFKKELKSTDEYSIELHGSNRLNSDFIILTGNLDDNMKLITRTSVQTISDSVNIFNKFLVIIGVIGIVIGGGAAYIVSKQVTRPIEKLNKISNKMANLDFSEKYNVKSDDEIGKLGENINKLSNKLEDTIKDLRKNNIKLERDIEEKSKIDEMRKQFLSDVSHELKTPIALIQGYAEGLSCNVANDEESREYYCNVIIDEAEKMDKLVKQLLTLSKIEYGNEKPKMQPFNITEMIEDIIKKQTVIFKVNKVKVNINTHKKYYVMADEFMIEQVFNNYINNAIKHVDENKQIVIRIKEVEDKIRVTVFNTGKQIPEEEQVKLWTRFYKSDTSRNREDGGTGIGLALVKAILIKHNNKYGVNNVNNGVEFFFELDKEK